MRIFIIAGILYLLGIAIVLVWKPSLMFTEQGIWKEFGIGRNPATHTWMPLWLFTILWAVVSYMFGNILESLFFRDSISSVDADIDVDVDTYAENIAKKSVKKGKLPHGYYLLNSEGSKNGIPSYIFLGKELPA